MPGATAQAVPLALRDVGPVMGPTVRSDGERLIATDLSQQAVQVLDTRTGTTQAVASPQGCSFADIHHATILWSCPNTVAGSPSTSSTGRALDLTTGQAIDLPAYVQQQNSNVDDAPYDAIGERWARVQVFGYHFSFAVFVDRRTGRFVQPQERPDHLADLDRSPLSRQLCQGQQRSMVPNPSFLGIKLGPLAVAGPWAAATSYRDDAEPHGRVLLQHCGRAPDVVKHCRTVECTQPLITDRWVAWAENRYVGDGEGRLVVRSLASGRTRRTAIRTSAPMTPLLVGERLYVVLGKRLLRASL